MIDQPQARKIVEERITLSSRKDRPVVIIDEATLETEFGWVFFYQSAKYLETKNFHHALVGNAPLIVDREDGSIHSTGTGRPTEYFIEEYRKQKKRRQRERAFYGAIANLLDRLKKPFQR